MTGSQREAAEQQRGPRKAPGGETEVVRVHMLGGFRVSVGSRSIGEEEWRLKKAASLLKLLALAPGHRLHRGQAVELLWPDLDSEAALNNLHHALHVARRTLEPVAPAGSAASRYLHLRDERLALCPEGSLWVDVEAFEEAAATARHALLEPAPYQAAMDVYAGELLPEDRYEPWVEGRRAELRGAYLSLLVELAGVYEQRKEFEMAIEALGRVVAEEPAHEGAHVGLMRLYALSGRRREALRQYERLRETLFRELGAEPEAAATRLQQEIWAGTFPPAHSPLPAGSVPGESAPPAEPRRHNLPLARTSFVGREREALEVKRLLAMTQLLTLTGAAGCGKTRLALKVTRDLAGAYPEGAWLVELAPLSEPELVPQAVAQALGVREQPGRPLVETLKDTLRSRKMLLVVDNCEHLIEAVVRLVDALLGTCPGLRVLATSRETLNAAGEVSWVVPSLTVPDSRQEVSTPEELEGYESVRLFVERAQQRDPSFALSLRNGPAVARICRRLDGIPLAIELAAARMGVLAVEQVAERLEDSLKLLGGGSWTVEPRHRTLRTTLDWSHDLLEDDERALFRQLSVFAGGWTLEAVEEVCSSEGVEEDDVLDLLSELVEKSLVVAEASPGAGGVLRYRMLEPVRQYGREKLEESTESAEVRRRHAEHYLAFAETAEPELLGADQGRWLQRLRTEIGNLRGAFSWSLELGQQEGKSAQEELRLRLVAALCRFWGGEGFEEGKRWLQAALKKDPGGFPAARAKALGGLGFILLFQQAYGPAIAALEEAIALHKELGGESGVALALGNLGYALLHGGYRERVPAFVEEGEALMQGDLDGHPRAYLRIVLAYAAVEEGDLDSAVSQLEEGLALCRELGDMWIASVSLLTLGMIELVRENLDRGATLIEEGARIARELRDRLGGVYGVWMLGKVAFLRGKPVRAARLWGAAEAFREHMGMSLSHFDLANSGYEQDLAAVRSTLGEASFDAAWTEGRAMPPERAIEYALSEEEEREPPTHVPVVEQPPADERTQRLTRREQEIALLVGRGLTNRRIASELAISERTVENHVGKILKKLGFASRARIATWVAQR